MSSYSYINNPLEAVKSYRHWLAAKYTTSDRDFLRMDGAITNPLQRQLPPRLVNVLSDISDSQGNHFLQFHSKNGCIPAPMTHCCHINQAVIVKHCETFRVWWEKHGKHWLPGQVCPAQRWTHSTVDVELGNVKKFLHILNAEVLVS